MTFLKKAVEFIATINTKKAVEFIATINTKKAPAVVKKRARNRKAPAKVIIAMPPDLLSSIDTISRQEERSRSELIRYALRLYVKKSNSKQVGF